MITVVVTLESCHVFPQLVKLSRDLLMKGGRLLIVHRKEGLLDALPDVSLDHRGEVGGEEVREVVGDVRTQQQLFDLVRKILWYKSV